MVCRFGLTALLTVTVTGMSTAAFAADQMDIDRIPIEVQGGLIGSHPTVGVRVAPHYAFSGMWTFQEVGLLHVGAYGLRLDEDTYFGALFMAGSLGVEPFMGLNFSLNSLYGFDALFEPGAMVHVPIGHRRLELSACALAPISGGSGGNSARVEARFYPDRKGYHVGAEVELGSNSLLAATTGLSF